MRNWLCRLQLCFVVLLALSGFAADQKADLSKSPQEPIAARAKHVTYDAEKGHAELKGDAQIDWGRFRLTADHVVFASAVDGTLQKIEAKGSVELTTEDGAASGGSAQYDAAREMIVLTIKPELAQGNHRMIDGERVTYDVKNGHFKAINARFVIDPKSISIDKKKK